MLASRCSHHDCESPVLALLCDTPPMTDPISTRSELSTEPARTEPDVPSDSLSSGSEPIELPSPPAAAAPHVPLGARQAVSQGFDLSIRATPQLRRASIYFGLQLMAIGGPFVILAA